MTAYIFKYEIKTRYGIQVGLIIKTLLFSKNSMCRKCRLFVMGGVIMKKPQNKTDLRSEQLLQSGCLIPHYVIFTRPKINIPSWSFQGFLPGAKKHYEICLPKVVEHLTFNLRNIASACWTDRGLKGQQMSLRSKPRLVHTCLDAFPDSSAAIVPISQSRRLK